MDSLGFRSISLILTKLSNLFADLLFKLWQLTCINYLYQMRSWDRTVETVSILAQAFFDNDPYYPRPRPLEPLYEDFKAAYKEQVPADYQHLADAFLRAIEITQAKRDNRRS